MVHAIVIKEVAKKGAKFVPRIIPSIKTGAKFIGRKGKQLFTDPIGFARGVGKAQAVAFGVGVATTFPVLIDPFKAFKGGRATGTKIQDPEFQEDVGEFFEPDNMTPIPKEPGAPRIPPDVFNFPAPESPDITIAPPIIQVSPPIIQPQISVFGGGLPGGINPRTLALLLGGGALVGGVAIARKRRKKKKKVGKRKRNCKCPKRKTKDCLCKTKKNKKKRSRR